MGYLIFARRGIGVSDFLSFCRLSVAEIPEVARDGLTGGFGFGCAVQLGGIAYAYFGVGETGNGQGVHDDFGVASSGLFADRGDTGISAAHLEGAVGNGGALHGGSETVRACPAVGGTVLCSDIQADGFADAIWTVVGGNSRQDTAVGLPRT